LRYRLLSHLYTLMFYAHTVGRTVHNAVWTHFSQDPITLEIDRQYMWSSSIIFTPVLFEGAVAVTGYFPEGVWYSLFDNTLIDTTLTGGLFVTLDTPLIATNAHARGGHVIPFQHSAMTTAEVYSSPYSLLVFTSGLEYLEGSLYIDDGTQNEISHFSLMVYLYQNNILSSRVVNSSFVLTTALLERVEIWGANISVSDICSATITTADGVKYVSEQATSETLVDAIGGGHNRQKLVFDFIDSISIIQSFDLSWECEASVADDAFGDDAEKKNSSGDDETGWDKLPSYGKGLVITAGALVTLSVAVLSYVVIRKKAKALSTPLLASEVAKDEGGRDRTRF
jgi:hypothetical protein